MDCGCFKEGYCLKGKHCFDMQNKFTREAADAAGTGTSGGSFKGDSQTVVADAPRPDIKPSRPPEDKQHRGMHLFTHHTD